jgi:hypothetical protein
MSNNHNNIGTIKSLLTQLNRSTSNVDYMVSRVLVKEIETLLTISMDVAKEDVKSDYYKELTRLSEELRKLKNVLLLEINNATATAMRNIKECRTELERAQHSILKEDVTHAKRSLSLAEDLSGLARKAAIDTADACIMKESKALIYTIDVVNNQIRQIESIKARERSRGKESKESKESNKVVAEADSCPNRTYHTTYHINAQKDDVKPYTCDDRDAYVPYSYW